VETGITAVKGIFTDAGIKEHFHQDYSVGIIWHNTHGYVHGKKEYIAKTGEMRIFSPYDLHRSLEGSWGYTQIFISPEFLTKFINDLTLEEGKLPNFALHSKDLKILQLSNTLYNALHNPMCDLLEIEQASSDFLSQLMHHTKERIQPQEQHHKTGKLNMAIEYIHAHLDQPTLTIEEIAREIGISPYHFARSFKKQFGLPPHKYIVSLRVEKAKKLILGGVPAAYAALQSGFSDQSHMIKNLRIYLGFTPTTLTDSLTKRDHF